LFLLNFTLYKIRIYQFLIERLSRFPIALATSNADGNSTLEMLRRIESMFGPPKRIVTDNGTHFVNKEVQALCSPMNTEHHKVLAYHPQANGIAERYVAVIKSALLKSSIKYPKDWDRMMPAILRYHRARPHSATGVSPFEVVYGQQLRINLQYGKAICTPPLAHVVFYYLIGSRIAFIL